MKRSQTVDEFDAKQKEKFILCTVKIVSITFSAASTCSQVE